MSAIRSQMESDHTTQTTGRMLTFRGGGWVILLALLLTLGLATWALLPALSRGPMPTPQNPEGYGFDLSNLRVASSELTAAIPKDSLPHWDQPPLVPDSAIGEQIRFGRDKYLVSTDRVVGLHLNGESRAYPISVLTVHEIINDTLAGVPVAVTYHPWCDSVVVFHRVVAGETVELRSSGMLMDSNLVLYDDREDSASESLFLQLSGAALAGPAADRRESLDILPVTLTTWADWRAAHPATRVIGWDERMIKRYEGSSHDQYFRDDKLAFPVSPLPPAGPLQLKDRIMAVTIAGQRRVYPFAMLAGAADDDGVVRDTLAGAPVEIRYDRDHAVAVVLQPTLTDEVHVIYALWFAWYAVHGDADVVGMGQQAGDEAAQPEG